MASMDHIDPSVAVMINKDYLSTHLNKPAAAAISINHETSHTDTQSRRSGSCRSVHSSRHQKPDNHSVYSHRSYRSSRSRISRHDDNASENSHCSRYSRRTNNTRQSTPSERHNQRSERSSQRIRSNRHTHESFNTTYPVRRASTYGRRSVDYHEEPSQGQALIREKHAGVRAPQQYYEREQQHYEREQQYYDQSSSERSTIKDPQIRTLKQRINRIKTRYKLQDDFDLTHATRADLFIEYNRVKDYENEELYVLEKRDQIGLCTDIICLIISIANIGVDAKIFKSQMDDAIEQRRFDGALRRNYIKHGGVELGNPVLAIFTIYGRILLNCELDKTKKDATKHVTNRRIQNDQQREEDQRFTQIKKGNASRPVDLPDSSSNIVTTTNNTTPAWQPAYKSTTPSWQQHQASPNPITQSKIPTTTQSTQGQTKKKRFQAPASMKQLNNSAIDKIQQNAPFIKSLIKRAL